MAPIPEMSACSPHVPAQWRGTLANPAGRPTSRRAQRFAVSSPHSPGLEHGELAISVNFGFPLESRLRRKLSQAVLLARVASANRPSEFGVLTR